MSKIIFGLLISTLSSAILSHFVKPRQKFFLKRHFSSVLIEIATIFFCYAVFLMIFRRPYFALTLLIGIQLLFVLVNNTKFYSLKEAFIFQDFRYFSNAIKYPRLYLPFFGLFKSVLLSTLFIAGFAMAIKYEQPVPFLEGDVFSISVIIFSILLISLSISKLPEINIIPNQDIVELGMIASFFKYWQAEKKQKINIKNSPFLIHKNKKAELKDIVVVQSESFFDPRKLSGAIDKNVLAAFDEIRSESFLSGSLKVPAFGAETVRTECAFLTGLDESDLGIHKFNPYQKLSKESVPNLVNSLKKLGYRTICVHPYYSDFYKRDKVFKLMGFDEFFDISQFDVKKTGQYIGDLDVLDKVKSIFNESKNENPLFIFVITMENHGPLHLEKPTKSDSNVITNNVMTSKLDDLVVYLKHLKNSDSMILLLRNFLIKRKSIRNSLFCFYGDHVPIMPSIFNQFGFSDSKTEFFIWDSEDIVTDNYSKCDLNLCIKELGVRLISRINY